MVTTWQKNGEQSIALLVEVLAHDSIGTFQCPKQTGAIWGCIHKLAVVLITEGYASESIYPARDWPATADKPSQGDRLVLLVGESGILRNPSGEFQLLMDMPMARFGMPGIGVHGTMGNDLVDV